ncbi:arsenic resistance operon repressor ArsR [Rhodococcus pyridinivorans AK37]|uniref:Arsenic resistance operon repressor ArsR n=1 Tax=Rhodococcus pyridinivorans AK37 TaxID=1114960 RepID=H0JMQ3_9NOCA|nr:arsenic resistance operon repressor ArsR [Rhodococcus pyridinivorans AK37]
MSNQDLAGDDACCSPLVRQPLTGDRAADLARMFKALGDPVRLRMLSLVASHAGGEACVCDISGSFDLSQRRSRTTSEFCARQPCSSASVAAPGCTTGWFRLHYGNSPMYSGSSRPRYPHE